MSRPVTGTAASAGGLDGLVDATNGRACDPRGRWARWHSGRPEEDWSRYRDAYFAAYVVAGKAARA